MKPRFRFALFAVTSLCGIGGRTSSEPAPLVLVREGRPNASIVTDKDPTVSANLAALELQYHIEKITGVALPIESGGGTDRGVRILVGESPQTRELGLKGADFEPQEYLIRFLPNAIVLIGRDALRGEGAGAEAGVSTAGQAPREIDYLKATSRAPQEGSAPKRVPVPDPYDDQGTCYAAYDFLERFCGVRWYGPTELNVVFPTTSTLTARGEEIRRRPALRYREGFPGGQDQGGWPIIRDQWNHGNMDEGALYARRLRVGGEKWTGNHSFTSFQDRFLKKNPARAELFESYHPEYFAKDQSGDAGSLQLCYSNPALIQQVAQDAIDYFDGKGLKGHQLALGDYFAVVPLDNASWCMCDRCQALLARDKDNRNGGHFNSGTATHYWFHFVNAVAGEVRKVHPDKYISTLAYHVYAFRPTDFELEPNVAVAPCLQVRNYWAPRIKRHEMDFYRKWVEPRDRPIYLWNYYCFPTEIAVGQGWNCFPGFYAHSLADLIKMYHRDGVRGVFLCGIGEQVDYYLTMKMYDDPSIDPDALLDEFFSLYFGAAAEPMKKFYLRIEEAFSDSGNYPEEVRTRDEQFHQTDEIAWGCLGTDGRMEELGALMRTAKDQARTDLERRRVRLWEKGVWEYMQHGAAKFHKKKGLRDATGPPPELTVPRIASQEGKRDLADVSWQEGALLGDWRELEGFATDRKIEGRILHDGRRLYIRLQEDADAAALQSSDVVYHGDDWEIFFAAGRSGAPYNQIAANPAGRCVVSAWDLAEVAVSDVQPSRWTFMLAIPLKNVLQQGIEPGGVFYANFYRAAFGPDGRELLAWSPNFDRSFHTTTRMGKFVLAK